MFRNGTIDGYTVAAIDGTKLFGSNIKSCPGTYSCKKTPEGKCSQVLVVTTDFDMPLQTLYNIMQLFIHRRLTSKITKEMPEKELIRLIEKDMYTYNEKLVIDTC